MQSQREARWLGLFLPFVAIALISNAGCSLTPHELAKEHAAQAWQENEDGSPEKESLPLRWRVGDIDAHFGVTEAQVVAAVQRACDLWDDASGKQLFQYDDVNGFPVDLVYDERQVLTEAEHAASQELHAAKHNLAVSREKEKEASSRYESAKAQLEAAEGEFNTKLQDYNYRVRSWNDSGGAPPDVLDSLKTEEQTLTTEKNKLNESEQSLDAMRQEANTCVTSYNDLATSYRTSVDTYNARFAKAGSQTIGQCLRLNGQVHRITIYAFRDMDHLTAVLAHELGHALGLQHVKGDGAIMSAIEKGEQYTGDLRLTRRDKAALKAALN